MQRKNSNLYKFIIAAAIIVVIVAAIVTLIVSLEDNGDGEDSGNRAPIAVAPEDITAGSGTTIILDASNSSDPEGDELVYHWDVDSSVDTNGDGDSTNDRDLTGILVEYTVPDIDEETTYDITLMVSDANQTSTDLMRLNVVDITYDEKPEILFTTNYGNPPGLVADPHYIITVERVTSMKDIDRFTYSIEGPDGNEYLSGDIEELVTAGLNETVRYTDIATQPEGVDKVSEGDSVLVRDNEEIIENSVFLLYYMDDPEEAGRAVLTKDIVP